MVDRDSRCRRRSRRFWRIRHAARLRRKLLFLGALPLALLFTADRPGASLVAILAGTVDSRWTSRLSRDLLLLPQSVLPRVFPRSARLCRWRVAPPQLSRGNRVSFHPPERPSLLFLSRGSVHHFSLVRRHPLFLFRGPFRNWCRHARPDDQRFSPFALHVFLSFAPPPSWRQD